MSRIPLHEDHRQVTVILLYKHHIGTSIPILYTCWFGVQSFSIMLCALLSKMLCRDFWLLCSCWFIGPRSFLCREVSPILFLANDSQDILGRRKRKRIWWFCVVDNGVAVGSGWVGV